MSSRAALVVALLALAGCPRFDVGRPPGFNGPEELADSFLYTFQLSWDGADLIALRSFSLDHPGDLEVEAVEAVPELTLVLPVKIQKPDHEKLAAEFQSELAGASSFTGPDPRIRVPPRRCELPGVGTCVGKLQLLVPVNARLAFDLSWSRVAELRGILAPELRLHPREGATLRLFDAHGEVRLSGGGPDAQVQIDGLKPLDGSGGGVDADLESISTLLLSRVEGPISIRIANPGQSLDVRVDGTRVSSFPFQRRAW
jgi:hypothetical protein